MVEVTQKWKKMLCCWSKMAQKLYSKRCKVGPKNGSKKRGGGHGKFGKVLCEIGKMLKIRKK